MANAQLISRLYSFAARADTFTVADVASAFADEFVGVGVLGRMPDARDVDDALRFLLDQRLIESAMPGAFRIGTLVSA